MPRLLIETIIASAIAILVCGCGNHQRATEEITQTYDYTLLAKEYADSVLAKMTREQRVGQLFMPAVYASADESTLNLIKDFCEDYNAGGIILLKGTKSAVRAISDSLATISSPAGIWLAIDAETGLAMRLSDARGIPSAAELGKWADAQAMYDYGRLIAAEADSIGINMVLGPVLDVESDPDGFIGRRAFGDDPQKVGELGVSLARGLEDGGMISAAKHFPGHGAATNDSHRQLAVINSSLAELEEKHLPPFQEYIDAGLSAVMVGHLAVPAIDSRMRSAALSEIVVHDLLRTDMGFKGLVITDAVNMKGAVGKGSLPLSVQALLAGADIILAPENLAEEIEGTLKAIDSGDLPMSRVDDAVRRILFFKYRSFRL